MAGLRRDIEIGIVALLEPAHLVASAGTLSKEAEAFARTVRLHYEWEGYPDGPLTEASSAETYLQQHTNSAIRLYVQLFLLHRYRSAFEAATYELQHYADSKPTPTPAALAEALAGFASARRSAADGYRRAWQSLSIVDDAVVRAVADELDRVAYLYLNVSDHPRPEGR